MNTVLNEEIIVSLDNYRTHSKLYYKFDTEAIKAITLEFLTRDEIEILNQFGLPNLRRYTKMLRSFGQTNNDDTVSRKRIINLLNNAAKTFLLRPVLPMAQRLELAKRNNENPLDILPEIGFATHHYNIFLYSSLFLNDQATADEIINDLCLARDNEELPFIFNLALISDYKNEPEYIFFKQSGFKFIDEYCNQKSFIPEPLSTQYEKIEEHTYRFFNLNNLFLTNIAFDAETGPTIFCTLKKSGKNKDLQIGMEFDQLDDILATLGENGERIKNLVTEKLIENADEDFAVIDLDNLTGELCLENCNLKIYRALEKTSDGKYAEYSGNFFMLEELI